MYWDAIHTRTGKTQFLAGDISAIDPRTLLDEVGPYNNDQHSFLFSRWDAVKLPVAVESVDIIWDRKGILWHAARGGNKKILPTIRKFHTVLKPNGIVVIDAIEGRQVQQEPSTFDLITERGTGSTWGSIGTFFTSHDVGSRYILHSHVLQKK